MKSRNEAATRIHPAGKGLRFVTGVLLCLLAVPSLSMAAVHYVRAGATGNGSGSDWTNAYPALPSSLIRGDTYYFAAGNYTPNGHTFNDPENGTEVITLKTATVADHGTNTGWSDSYAGQVNFGATLALRSGYYTFDGSYRTDWEGTYGMKVTLPSGCVNACYAFWLEGDVNISNVAIAYVDMPGYGQNNQTYQQQYGLFAMSGFPSNGGAFSNITLDHDYIHDEGVGGTPLQYNWMTNLTVQYCDFARITYSTSGGGATHSEVIADEGPTNNVTFRYNRCVDIQGTGEIVVLTANYIRTIQNYYIYGNLFWQKNSGNYMGPGVIDCVNGQICSHWYIYNNTFADFGGTQSANGINWSAADTSSMDIQVNDNLWYNSTSVTFPVSASGQIVHDYNYFASSSGYPGETHIQTGSTNPFADSINGDFHLAAETKDGLHLSSPYDIDPDGVKRGSDNNIWSRGAYQYAPRSASSPDPPANLTVVGVH